LPSDSDEEDDAVVTDTSANDQSPNVDLNTNSAGYNGKKSPFLEWALAVLFW